MAMVQEALMMTGLQDIFPYPVPATVFLFGLAVLLLLCAAAALWPWRKLDSRRSRQGSGQVLALADQNIGRRAPTTVRSQDRAMDRRDRAQDRGQDRAGDAARAGA
jgi:hypothetical protein